MTSPIEFQSIDHITLIVADLTKTREFYCDQLGMHQVTRPDFDFPGLWLTPALETSNQTGLMRALIHITLADESSGLPGWGDRQVGRLSRGHHFAFEVADAIAACEHLQQLGVAICGEPRRRPDGAAQFCIQDPDGHVIEIFSQPSND